MANEAINVGGNSLDNRESMHRVVEQLSPDATWDDVIYEMAVRRDIERGLADSNAGQVVPVENIMKEFGIQE